MRSERRLGGLEREEMNNMEEHENDYYGKERNHIAEHENDYYRYQKILAIDQRHMITSHVEDNTKVTSAYERDSLGLMWTRVWTIEE